MPPHTCRALSLHSLYCLIKFPWLVFLKNNFLDDLLRLRTCVELSAVGVWRGSHRLVVIKSKMAGGSTWQRCGRCMLLFGLCYGLWGLYRVKKNKTHKHFDMYEDGTLYVYEHKHGQMVQPADRHKVTAWVMFIVFLLGPCEPMIPLLYFPAAKNLWAGMMILIIIYTICTLATMVLMVVLGYYGFSFLKTEKLERYMHPLGGLTVFICGVGMVFMDW